MKKFTSSGLLEKLQSDTRQIILETNYLLQQDPERLILQPAERKWSVAQVIEHLNTYCRYYFPRIEQLLQDSSTPPEMFYKPGWLGDYFTTSMLPKENGKITHKMQAPKAHRPDKEIDSKETLDEFLLHQHHLLQLLENAKSKNIGKIRIPISITRLIRLKLGDMFRFLVAHHQRHFLQASNTLKVVRTQEMLAV